MIPDRLIEWLISIIDLFFFVRVVDTWEAGVVLRLGHFHRNAGPGWHFVAPFKIERLITTHTNRSTTRLDPQSLTTADGVAVVISAVVTWRVTSARKVLLECDGHQQVMLDSSTGVLAEFVTGVTWADLVTEEFRRTITSAVAQKAKKWGIKVIQVQLCDVTRCRSLRLFSAHSPQVH